MQFHRQTCSIQQQEEWGDYRLIDFYTMSYFKFIKNNVSHT